LRSKFDFKSGPDMRPIAMSTPQYGDPVPLARFTAFALCRLTTVCFATAWPALHCIILIYVIFLISPG